MKTFLTEKLIYGFNWISEQANSVSKTEERITDLSSPLLSHLIKILKWEDNSNNSKHCKDIDQKWLSDLEDLFYRSKIKIKRGRVYDWLYGETEKLFLKKVKKLEKSYDSLKPYRSDEEVKDCVERIIQYIDNTLQKEDTIPNILDICEILNIEVRGV